MTHAAQKFGWAALCVVAASAIGCAGTPKDAASDAAGGTVEVTPAPEVAWTALNPARGDKSPGAATLWGDRGADTATGFLVRFVDGFSSPPHIHNVTYRGVVISGLVHNDDPAAAKMWMPPGSFWTQPAGESHITAAKGEYNVAYIEIDAGPYLVQPPGEAFDNGERPVNVDASNIVWLDATDIAWLAPEGNADGVEVAFLWGDPRDKEPAGMMLRLPAGFDGTIHADGPAFRAVVIEGRVDYLKDGATGADVLEPGSYFGSTGAASHAVSCGSSSGSTLYVRYAGKLRW
ncbi:MAG: DUF4437 domain-containing protein [Planctomycetota bacterium]